MQQENIRIAVIGQSAFSAEFIKKLVANNYIVCGAFTIQDDPRTGREDVFATAARQLNIPVFKFKRWRVPPDTDKAIDEVFAAYMSVKADLNVLPYCNQFVPMQVINYPKLGSINYHPSLLPKHRGAASINWTLIEGDKLAGFTIFWTDAGLDTGPILLKKSCFVRPNDTVETLYSRFLFPAGVDGLVEAVELIRAGQAPKIPQSEIGASYDPILRGKEERCELDFNLKDTALQVHNFIRGLDKVPGAWISLKVVSHEQDASNESQFERVRLFGSSLYSVHDFGIPQSKCLVQVKGLKQLGIIHEDGLLLFANGDGKPVNVSKVQIVSTGKTILASSYGSAEANAPTMELSEEETKYSNQIKSVWSSILATDSITKSTDFFNLGASSMDVTRLVEEVKDIIGDSLELENEDVYMATQFDDFVSLVVRRLRGETSNKCKLQVDYKPVVMSANKLSISFPNQLFIDNRFIDSVKPEVVTQSINPTTEEVICEVQVATKIDVDKAVKAAKRAFDTNSPWRKMDARERGKLLYKLADLMEEHKQELATIESIDSGAIYTLAIKTHIGMSIDVFRYFAGWCDKIQGSVIPINNAKPNANLAYTKKEPIGVCGIITPWNYPLMMVAWKSAACLAAGNTLVLKPAQVCPLTALKWAELIVKAGFPPGVVNIVPGRGGECGQAILDHPDIRKVGFTGSTPTGKLVMEACAKSNIKKCSLELGGKSPLIIFADCDLKKAVKFGMSSVFFNKGENCIAAGRIFVEDSIHDQFVSMVVEETKKICIDDPLKRSSSHGPQNHLKHLNDLIEYCKKGVEEGATLVYGGKRLERKGYFFMPTIFTDVKDKMFIAKEESFGPIMIISKFANEDIEGVIRRANRTNYGLASGVMTSDMSKALRVADAIDAGTCFINVYNKTDVAAPFGGFKESGFGKDLGKEALDEYLRTKCIIAEY